MASPFKVIVAGGGPVGLTAAHALTRAGIDFIVLERQKSPFTEAGSSLVLNPQAMRILSQLGLLDALHSHGPCLVSTARMDHQGNDLGAMQWFDLFKNDFGAYPRFISRHDLTKILYESLPVDSQAKILTNKTLTSIGSTPDGVNVHCADGTTHSGTIVLAADGAHSIVRNTMRDLALQNGGAANDEKPFLTTYRCLWFRFPSSTMPDQPAGSTSETHGPGASTQSFLGDDSGVTGVYERMGTPTRDRAQYTKADERALVDRWGHLPLMGGVTIRSAYETSMQSGLVNLEEGVVKNWHWGGRVVLAGDAAHKFTPSTGLGCNFGIIDTAALVNELHDMMVATEGKTPTKEQISAAFQAYQDVRYAEAVSGCKEAGDATTMSTWSGGVAKLMDKWLFPRYFAQRFFWNLGAKQVAKTPVLRFVQGKEEIVGAVPWVYPLSETVKT